MPKIPTIQKGLQETAARFVDSIEQGKTRADKMKLFIQELHTFLLQVEAEGIDLEKLKAACTPAMLRVTDAKKKASKKE